MSENPVRKQAAFLWSTRRVSWGRRYIHRGEVWPAAGRHLTTPERQLGAEPEDPKVEGGSLKTRERKEKKLLHMIAGKLGMAPTVMMLFIDSRALDVSLQSPLLTRTSCGAGPLLLSLARAVGCACV